MVDRYLKIVFTAMLGLMVLLYVAHNWANYDRALAAFGYVTTHQEHAIYPANLLPALSPPLQIAALLTVFIGEMAAAFFLLWGSFTLWRHRSTDAVGFETAKTRAKIGCGLAIFVWWGLFQVIGGAGYQMWQSPQGAGPFTGSWIYGGISMMVLIYLSLREPEPAN